MILKSPICHFYKLSNQKLFYLKQLMYYLNLKKHISNIEKKDLIKFFLYTTIFTVLFFGYNKAISPKNQVEYYSAPKDSVKYFNLEKQDKPQEFYLWKKDLYKPLLSLSYNPNNSKIDEYLIKSINLHADSNKFREKITPLNLVIDLLRSEPRWQVSWWKLILSWKMTDLRESIKVFVHELGHIVDLYYLSNFADYDPSNNFYNISWISYNIKHKNAKLWDFVSWYAITNKYEDFAESFSFYIFHNEEFYKRAIGNDVLMKKYNFFKKQIFDNSEFRNTSFERVKLASYNWDSTKIWINLKKYLYYIK